LLYLKNERFYGQQKDIRIYSLNETSHMSYRYVFYCAANEKSFGCDWFFVWRRKNPAFQPTCSPKQKSRKAGYLQ